jgi:hypothetical protein
MQEMVWRFVGESFRQDSSEKDFLIQFKKEFKIGK